MTKKILLAVPIMLLAVGIPTGSVVQSYNTKNDCKNVEREFPAIDFSQAERGEDEIGDIADYAMDGDLSRATVAPTAYCDDGISMVIRDADGRIVETYGPEYFDAAQLADGAAQCDDAILKDPVDFKDNISEIKAAVLNEGRYYVETQYGESIASLCDGVVASSQYEKGYGYCVTIIDEEKRVWKYGHCSELLVEEGASVSSGDIIAYAGNSGLTTGGVTVINVN